MIKWDIFNKAVSERNRKWMIMDNFLYNLCREYPLHNNSGEIRAKIFIIGRSYASGIERTIHTNNKQGSSLDQLADFLYQKSKIIDSHLQSLMKLDGTQPKHFQHIVDVHGSLTKLLENICFRSPRSFISKYMHFHCPIVPIYDSYTSPAIRKIIQPDHHADKTFQSPSVADKQYNIFCKRFWILYNYARHTRPNVLVKELDRYLCGL